MELIEISFEKQNIKSIIRRGNLEREVNISKYKISFNNKSHKLKNNLMLNALKYVNIIKVTIECINLILPIISKLFNKN